MTNKFANVTAPCRDGSQTAHEKFFIKDSNDLIVRTRECVARSPINVRS